MMKWPGCFGGFFPTCNEGHPCHRRRSEARHRFGAGVLLRLPGRSRHFQIVFFSTMECIHFFLFLRSAIFTTNRHVLVAGRFRKEGHRRHQLRQARRRRRGMKRYICSLPRMAGRRASVRVPRVQMNVFFFFLVLGRRGVEGAVIIRFFLLATKHGRPQARAEMMCVTIRPV